MEKILETLAEQAVTALTILVPAAVALALAWLKRWTTKVSLTKEAVTSVESESVHTGAQGPEKLESAVAKIRKMSPWYARQGELEVRARVEREVRKLKE